MPGQISPPTPEDKPQAEASKDSAAQHVNPDAGRYPSTNRDDSVASPSDKAGERRSFDSDTERAGPTSDQRRSLPDPSVNEGRLGPDGDPAEGKR